jgi:hypothetical protein
MRPASGHETTSAGSMAVECDMARSHRIGRRVLAEDDVLRTDGIAEYWNAFGVSEHRRRCPSGTVTMKEMPSLSSGRSACCYAA